MPHETPPARAESHQPPPPPQRPAGLPPKPPSDIERAASRFVQGLSKSIAEVEAVAERDRAIAKFFDALTGLAESAKILVDAEVASAQRQ